MLSAWGGARQDAAEGDAAPEESDPLRAYRIALGVDYRETDMFFENPRSAEDAADFGGSSASSGTLPYREPRETPETAAAVRNAESFASLGLEPLLQWQWQHVVSCLAEARAGRGYLRQCVAEADASAANAANI